LSFLTSAATNYFPAMLFASQIMVSNCVGRVSFHGDSPGLRDPAKLTADDIPFVPDLLQKDIL
jgi:hypothetical protein